MPMCPPDREYTRDHEWIAVVDGRARIGITDYAQREIGEIVYVELPEVGRAVKQGEAFGTIESVKAVSEVFSPMTGEVVDVNVSLTEHPESINSDPYGSWIVAVKMTNPNEANALLDSEAYANLVK